MSRALVIYALLLAGGATLAYRERTADREPEHRPDLEALATVIPGWPAAGPGAEFPKTREPVPSRSTALLFRDPVAPEMIEAYAAHFATRASWRSLTSLEKYLTGEVWQVRERGVWNVPGLGAIPECVVWDGRRTWVLHYVLLDPQGRPRSPSSLGAALLARASAGGSTESLWLAAATPVGAGDPASAALRLRPFTAAYAEAARAVYLRGQSSARARAS